MAAALDGGEDVVGGLGPAEGLGIGVVRIDEGTDIMLELLGGPVDAAPELLFGEQGEEALDLIEPSIAARSIRRHRHAGHRPARGRAGRGEVDVPTRRLGQPVADRLGLVVA